MMTNQQFINQVKDLINYYTMVEKKNIENNMTYSGIGMTQGQFKAIDEKVQPLRDKLDQVAKELK
jgi:hypothetical protein